MTFAAQITIPVAPEPKRRVRAAATSNGRVITYKDKKTRAFERDMVLYLRQYAPKTPIRGPVKLRIEFVHPRPVKMLQRTHKGKPIADGRIWKATRPDVDNLTKSVLDCCQDLFFHDDGQIADLQATDQYCERGAEPRIELFISSIGGADVD